MKKFTLPVAVGVGILGCVLAVSANVTTNEMRKTLEKERYSRILAEEKLQTASAKINALTKDIADSANKIASIEEILNVGNTANSELKAQLDALVKQNEALRQQQMQVQTQESAQK